jgi:thioredoxin reductase (NADPH)
MRTDDPRAAVVVVDDDPDALAPTEAELRNRYSADYDILAFTDPEEALTAIRALKADGRQMALVLADLWMPTMTGLRFLDLADDVFPTTKRALLVSWQDQTARGPILEAFAMGSIDCHLPKPTRSPDEAFHQVVTEGLAEWSKAHAVRRPLVRVIGDHGAPRCHEMRDLLERYSVPYRFLDASGADGQALLGELGVSGETKPVLALHDGRFLVDPTNQAAADALGGAADLTDRAFDVVVVGAGPAGLAAAVYAASEGLRTLVVEREAIGGQAGTTSRIRNYLGFPRGVTGSDLASRAYEQALHFGAHFHLMRESIRLRPGFPFHEVELSDGAEVSARAVVVATGVTYCRLEVPSLERLVGRGVFYSPSVSEAPAMADQPVFIVGGGNSAGQAAIHLARYAATVTLLIRGTSLVESMSDYLIREIRATANIDVRLRTEAVAGIGDHRLEGLVLRDRTTGTSEHVTAAGLFVLIGGEPRTDWLPPEIERSENGYVLTGPEVPNWEALALETTVPGVFAAGDVRHGAMKRVASAAGEGAMVVALVHQHLARSQAQAAAG